MDTWILWVWNIPLKVAKTHPHAEKGALDFCGWWQLQNIRSCFMTRKSWLLLLYHCLKMILMITVVVLIKVIIIITIIIIIIIVIIIMITVLIMLVMLMLLLLMIISNNEDHNWFFKPQLLKSQIGSFPRGFGVNIDDMTSKNSKAHTAASWKIWRWIWPAKVTCAAPTGCVTILVVWVFHISSTSTAVK